MIVNLSIGFFSAVLLMIGAAWPDSNKKIAAIKSVKNWLFAIGGLGLLVYAWLGYIAGGSIFFVILELLILLATILMMLETSDVIDTVVLSVGGIACVIWSMYLFSGYETILFVFGLIFIAFGYAFTMGSVRRQIALLVGSVLVAWYSWLGPDWIFFFVNIFFALFSGYYTIKKIVHK